MFTAPADVGLVTPGERRLQASLWTGLATLGVALCLHLLFRRGMYYDGALYATIARNLSQGLGDAWHPQATATFMHDFREHPPLAFWLQALCFRVLGDRIWVERAYSAAAGLITALLIVGIWRRLFAGKPWARRQAWLPVTLWVSCSSWSYLHNMLENTLGLFTALSVYGTLRASDRCRWSPLWSLLAGISVTAAVLTKGPVGLFPLVAPATAWFCLRRTSWRAAAGLQLLFLLAVVVSLGVLLSMADCRAYLAQYWQQQVVASLAGRREGTPTLLGHFRILALLAQVIVIPLVLATALVLAARWRRAFPSAPEQMSGPERFARPGMFCLLTALCATLPLVLSPKQAGSYAVPSYPFFALALSAWCLPALHALTPVLAPAISQRVWLAVRWTAVATLAVAALHAWSGYGDCARHRQLIETADQIAERFPPHSIVFVEPASWERLPLPDRLLLHTYLYRYHFVSLSTYEPEPAWKFEFHRLKPLPPGWAVSDAPVAIPGGLMCSAVVREPVAHEPEQRETVVRRPVEMTARLPSIWR